MQYLSVLCVYNEYTYTHCTLLEDSEGLSAHGTSIYPITMATNSIPLPPLLTVSQYHGN